MAGVFAGPSLCTGIPSPQGGAYAGGPGYGPGHPQAPHASRHPTGPIYAQPQPPGGQAGGGQPGAPYGEFADTTTHLPREVLAALDEPPREPTPPLFSTLGNKTMVTPPSERGGTLPPGPLANESTQTGTQPPAESERSPQSTTSPNTPTPEASPSPPPARATAATEITVTNTELPLSELDPEDTVQANLTQPVAPVRPFVEDGKTTQLSFTSFAHPFALSLEQYAALCAERDIAATDPERVRKIHKRYEISDTDARDLVDRLFQLRFDDDEDLHAAWRDAYDKFTARLRDRD